MKFDIGWTEDGHVHIGDPDHGNTPYVTIEFHNEAKNLSQLTKLQLLHRGLAVLLTREKANNRPGPVPDCKTIPDPDVEPPDFEAVDEGWSSGKEDPVSTIPEAPPPNTPPVPIAMIRDGDSGPFCMYCGSSIKRFWLLRKGAINCIQPECINYYRRKL